MEKERGKIGMEYHYRFLHLLKSNISFLIYLLAVSLSAAVLCYTFLPRRYSSYVTILPSPPDRHGFDSVRSGPIGISLLLDLSDDSSMLALYPEILRSRRIGLDILRREYSVLRKGRRVKLSLMDYIGKRNEDAALAYLNSRLASFWIDHNSKTFVIRVTTDDPGLSAQIANAYVERLELFNRMERKSTSREVYNFIKERFSECAAKLRQAELELRDFRSRHREFAISSSPELQIEHLRLMREVELNNALYIELGKELKNAELEMEKDTPVLNVLDRAQPQAKPDWPVASHFIPAVTAIGVMIGLIWLFLADSIERTRESEVKGAIEELLKELKEDVKLFSLVHEHE